MSASLYSNSEFISPAHFHSIMSQNFPSSELLVSYSDTHGVYKIRVEELLEKSREDVVVNWSFNRPPDMVRCEDIARYLYATKKPIDTMLYVSYVNKEKRFTIFDGIHRLTAMCYLREKNLVPLNLLCPEEFGSGGDARWLYDQFVLVNMRFNATFEIIVDAFRCLNKCQSVPELYIKDTAKEKREIVESIANEWQSKYGRHFSSSARPNKGNTNRNLFVGLLDRIYDEMYLRKNSSKEQICRKLDEINADIRLKIPSKTTLDARVKCSETGCYLFLVKNDDLLKKYYYK